MQWTDGTRDTVVGLDCMYLVCLSPRWSSVPRGGRDSTRRTPGRRYSHPRRGPDNRPTRTKWVAAVAVVVDAGLVRARRAFTRGPPSLSPAAWERSDATKEYTDDPSPPFSSQRLALARPPPSGGWRPLPRTSSSPAAAWPAGSWAWSRRAWRGAPGAECKGRGRIRARSLWRIRRAARGGGRRPPRGGEPVREPDEGVLGVHRPEPGRDREVPGLRRHALLRAREETWRGDGGRLFLSRQTSRRVRKS